MSQYVRPDTLDEAVKALESQRWAIVAGGTDYYPALVGKPQIDDVLDISNIASLRSIDAAGQDRRIGALVTWSDLLIADLPTEFDGLKAAAREVGGQQIQNAATLCGNLCNASPAADGVPPLLTLNAKVEIASKAGVRSLAVEDFVLGNRRTALKAGEIVSAILIPKNEQHGSSWCSSFAKLGARKYLVISIAMVAVAVEVTDDGFVKQARIAVGACTEVATRIRSLEHSLAGAAIDRHLSDRVDPAHFADLRPIDDIRASGPYRAHSAFILTRRAIDALVVKPLGVKQ